MAKHVANEHACCYSDPHLELRPEVFDLLKGSLMDNNVHAARPEWSVDADDRRYRVVWETQQVIAIARVASCSPTANQTEINTVEAQFFRN
jgi:hypothetical protein